MFSSPIFTITNILAALLLLITLILQFMEMSTYGMPLF